MTLVLMIQGSNKSYTMITQITNLTNISVDGKKWKIDMIEVTEKTVIQRKVLDMEQAHYHWRTLVS